MNYLKSSEDFLSYRFSKPAADSASYCVLFVHAAEGNMLGPHRMFVEFERAFNSRGIATFRFDFAGCGDSTGTAEYNPVRDQKNLADVIKYLSEAEGVNDIVMLGMSRGAYCVCEYIKSCPKQVRAAILLSPPVSTIKSVKKVLSSRLREYFLKLASRETYVKFVKNRINYKLVFKTIFQVFSKERSYSSDSLENLANCPTLFIYGENDPLTSESKSHYIPLFESAGCDVECEIIERANHSFFHYKWKEQIINIILSWLQTRCK